MIKNKIKKWLDIKDPAYDKNQLEKIHKDYKDIMMAEVSRVNDEVEHWKRIAQSFSTIPCDYCKEMMYVYPFGGAYYILPNQGKVHSSCYDDYLEEKRNVPQVS